MDSRLREPEKIFEWYVEISRPKDGEDGNIISVYPKDQEIEDDTRKQLPKFAFPTAVVNDSEEHFTFVLTDLDSKYRFGFCLYRPKGDTCMCIISDLPWYKVFYRALDKISELKLDMQNELVEPLLSGLYSHALPSPGAESLSVKPSAPSDAPSYSFPLPSNTRRLPEIPTDHNLTYFYTNIHYNVLLHLFANMIYERRIIITSSSLSLLSASVHGCVMLLYPLHWQHIFIPIMPQHLKDYCAAPMPYLMGVHSSLMDDVRRMPMDDVVILDMDDSVIESPNVDDLTNMPSEVIAELKHVLKKESSGYGDNACKAFMLAMVSMIGGYRKALKFREGEKEVVFDEEAFFTSRHQMEEFLASLLHFQHFRQFINQKIDQLKNQSIARDLFDKEAMFYDEELKGTTQEQIKAAFNKFLTSTRGGGKRLLEHGGKLSSQLQKGMTKGYGKIVDKKAIKKFVKDTKKTFQDMGGKDSRSEELEENGPDKVGTPCADKSYTFPMSSNLSQSDSGLSSSGGQTGQPPVMAVKKLPPRVIPYHKHQEGKKRLADVLFQQSQRTSFSSMDHGDVYRMLTSPDTPHTLQPPSDDHMEKASLDSRGSTEASASVSSGDVATGTLIDIIDESRKNIQTLEVLEGDKVQGRKMSSTGSDSMVSTASSSSEELSVPTAAQRQGWVHFDVGENTTPPLPPPRSQLDNLISEDGAVLANPVVVSGPGSNDLVDSNPFSRTDASNSTLDDFTLSGRISPFEDFSAQVAHTLYSQSRNRTSIDAYTADLMASASRDIYMALGPTTTTIPESSRESEAILLEPLIPNSSSTSLDSTSCLNTHPSTNPFAPSPLKSTSNGFPSSSSHPLMQREWVRPRGPPPPKPQPYSGKPPSLLQQQSISNDPFSNLLEGMSMQAYAHSSNKCSAPAAGMLPAASQETTPTAVESPLV